MHSDLVRRKTLVDQTVDHLRERIHSGEWGGHLPGERRLAALLGVSRPTVVAAVARLVAEGSLINNGARRGLKIDLSVRDEKTRKKSLRVTILLRWPLERVSPASQRTVLRIMTLYRSLGHAIDHVAIPAGADHRKADYLQKLVRAHPSDAWIAVDGTAEALAWFVARGLPVFAVAGSFHGLPVAAGFGMDTRPVMKTVVRRLVALGHRRIVLICFRTAREPEPGPMLRTFREELTEAGIKPGEYNVPDWEETPQGVLHLLESLFHLTPPTAILCHNLGVSVAVHTFLARRGLRIPGDVSLVSLVGADALAYWSALGVRFAHVEVNAATHFNRLRRWTDNLVKGREDTRQVFGRGSFIEADTVGAAPPDKA